MRSRWAVHLRHRRPGSGQSDPDQRHPLRPRRLSPPTAATSNRPCAGIERLDHFDKIINVDQSPIGRTPRSNPPPTPACSPHPRPVRRRARGQSPRLRPGGASVSTSRAAAAKVPGRRHDQGRDALPARHVRALRHLPRQALQPRNPGDPLQGQDHLRGARHDRRAGAEFFSTPCRSSPAKLDAPDAGRPRLHPPRPERHHALRRRGPAGQAGAGTVKRDTGRTCTSSTSPPPACTSPTSRCCSPCSTACATTATPWWSSSTTSTSSRPPTGSSTWAPRVATAAARWSAAPESPSRPCPTSGPPSARKLETFTRSPLALIPRPTPTGTSSPRLVGRAPAHRRRPRRRRSRRLRAASYAMLLSPAGATAAFTPLLLAELGHLDEAAIDAVFASGHASYGRALASTCDGDIAPLTTLRRRRQTPAPGPARLRWKRSPSPPSSTAPRRARWQSTSSPISAPAAEVPARQPGRQRRHLELPRLSGRLPG